MFGANKVFHLRQPHDPQLQIFEMVGMVPTESSVLSQIKTMRDYSFEEVFYITPLDEKIYNELKHKGIRLTQLALERKNDTEDVLYLINKNSLLESFSTNDKILWVMSDRDRPTPKELIAALERFKNLYFYFAPKIELGDPFLSCRQVYKLIKAVSPQKLRPYPGLNIYEPRAPKDLIFYPRASGAWSFDSEQEIQHSIIIPAYGQKTEVLRTLERLLFQTTADYYEVILVDDGDNEDLSLCVKELLKQKHQISRFQYLMNPRLYPRRMGDHRFRAGISRNFALRFARGEKIHFLDADVLVPRTYLDTVSEELDEADLVQIQRYDLTRAFTQSMQPIEDINEKEDILYHGRDYWYQFFKSGPQWMHMKCPWKFVCTYGISMRKDYLSRIGGIRTNTIFYGFEDTDLGYRVWRSGGRLKLSCVKSYHQFHEERRSEFKNSNRLRRKLMSNSGKLFFLNHLEPEIYEELIDYLFPRYSIKEWVDFLFLNWWRRPKKNRPENIPSPLVN